MGAIMDLLTGDHDGRGSIMRQRSGVRPMSHRASSVSGHTYCGIPVDESIPSGPPPRGTLECPICW